MEERSIIKKIDWITAGLYLFLVLLGWISIYAAVYDESHSNIFDVSRNYGKQLIWILSSFGIAAAIFTMDSKFFSNFSYVFYGLSLALLVFVLFFGRTVGGNQSWIEIGPLRLQPAEFAKFSTALVFARYLGGSSIKMQDFNTKLICILIIGVPLALILLQGDLGSAITYLAFILVMYREGLSGNVLIIGLLLGVMFLVSLLIPQLTLLISLASLAFLLILFFRKNKSKIFLIIIGFVFSIGIVLGVGYIFNKVLKQHHRDRIETLLGQKVDLKGVGYNVNQSKIAIGSGGFWGKGFLQGTQTKYDFVPEQSTDFIFCTIGEEYGFLGSLILIVAFISLLVRIVNIAERQRSAFSRIYAYCVGSILFIHITINIGMTVGLLPVIGIPLPFISYGGSSLWSFTILLFILLKLDSNRMAIIR